MATVTGEAYGCVTQLVVEVLQPAATSAVVRLTQGALELGTVASAGVRLTQGALELGTVASADVRLTQAVVELVLDGVDSEAKLDVTDAIRCFIYTPAKRRFAQGQEAWDTNTYKAMLVTSSYRARTRHEFVSTASPFEISVTGYSAAFSGGGRISFPAITVVSVGSVAELRGGTLRWSAIQAATAAAMIIMREVNSDGMSPLIAYLQTSAWPIITNGGDFIVSFASNTIIRFVSP